MRLDVVPARSFDGSSRVSTYWLANCEGFRVRSRRRRGHVVDVVVDAATGRPESLVVRFGLFRRRVAVGDVGAVVPAEALLILAPRGRRSPRVAPAARRARAVGGRAARAGGRVSLRGARAGARSSRRAASATGRTGVRLAGTTARETHRLARWLAPRVELAARAFWRAAGAAAVFAALALAAALRGLQALAVSAVARIRAEPPEQAPEDESAGRARQHAA